MPARTIRRITVSHAIGLIALGLVAIITLLATNALRRDAATAARAYQVKLAVARLDARLTAVDAATDAIFVSRDSAALAAAAVADSQARLAAADLRRVVPAMAPTDITAFLDQQRAARANVAAGSGSAALRQADSARPAVARTLDGVDRASADTLAVAAQAQQRHRAELIVSIVLIIGGVTVVTWRIRRTLVRDIRDRAAIERQLRASEARYAGILEIAADAIISVNEAYAIVHFNDAAEAMFGYASTEILGQPLDVLIPMPKVADHRRDVAGFARSPETARRMGERQQVAGRRRDGREFPADVSISKLTTPTGTLFTAVVRDVTEQRRTAHDEHTLAVIGARLGATIEYEAMLRLVVELPVHTIGDWCILDIIERDDYGEPRLRRLASAHSDRLQHEALRTLAAAGLDWDSPSEVIDVLRTAKAMLHSDVSADWLEAHAFDTTDAGLLTIRSLLCVPLIVRDSPIGTLTIGRHDATLTDRDVHLARVVADQSARAIDNTLLHRRAQRASAARDETLAVVSHDLRTPASAVTMCVRTLLDHPPESDAGRRGLYVTIADAAQWMHRLIQDLLDAASIDAGHLDLLAAGESAGLLIHAARQMFAGHGRGGRHHAGHRGGSRIAAGAGGS